MFEDDYWDSPAYNDFWRGAPGLPPPSSIRPSYGPLQVRSPDELGIGREYMLNVFTGVRAYSFVIRVTGKNEKQFWYETSSPDVEHRGRMTFADSSILPHEAGIGFWNDVNYVLRIEYRGIANY